MKMNATVSTSNLLSQKISFLLFHKNVSLFLTVKYLYFFIKENACSPEVNGEVSIAHLLISEPIVQLMSALHPVPYTLSAPTGVLGPANSPLTHPCHGPEFKNNKVKRTDKSW